MLCRCINTWKLQFTFIISLIATTRTTGGESSFLSFTTVVICSLIYHLLFFVHGCHYVYPFLSSWLLFKLSVLSIARVSINKILSFTMRFNNFLNSYSYVKSRSDQQLLHGLNYNDTSSCKPEESNNGLPIVPCGLIAWSLFNDTFTFVRGTRKLNVDRKNIAWKSDRNHKFGKQVYPFNFQNGTLIGGAKLDPSIPVSINWCTICMLLF